MEALLAQLKQEHGITLQRQVPLAEHTTFRIGGNAAYWAEIVDEEMLRILVQSCTRAGKPYFVLGKGSNVLAADTGYDGLILHIGDGFSEVTADGCSLTCQAGASLARVSGIAAQAGLSGMEGLSGIPGTIGGALFMNAGAYGYEMRDIVTSCRYLDADGNIQTAEKEALALSYRHSRFMEAPGIILSVTVGLHPGDPKQIADEMAALLARRSEKQPLNFPSAGSTFKRPAGSYASLLIDQCGLRGRRFGGAQVSEKHAGFVVNTGGATCADVLALCQTVQQEVQEKTGYVLELEPVLLGVEPE